MKKKDLIISRCSCFLLSSMVPIFIMFLALFTSGIQVFIFATIAATYVAGSMEGHHSLSFEVVYFSLVQGSFMPYSR